MHFIFLTVEGVHPEVHFNITIPSDQGRNSLYKDKTVLRSLYLYNGNPYSWEEYIEPGCGSYDDEISQQLMLQQLKL